MQSGTLLLVLISLNIFFFLYFFVLLIALLNEGMQYGYGIFFNSIKITFRIPVAQNVCISNNWKNTKNRVKLNLTYITGTLKIHTFFSSNKTHERQLSTCYWYNSIILQVGYLYCN